MIDRKYFYIVIILSVLINYIFIFNMVRLKQKNSELRKLCLCAMNADKQETELDVVRDICRE